MRNQLAASSAKRYDAAQQFRRASAQPMSAWAQKMMDDALASGNVRPLAGGSASEQRDSRSAAASDSVGSKRVREPKAPPPKQATQTLAQAAARNQRAASDGKQSQTTVDELAKSPVRGEAQPQTMERNARPAEATTPNPMANANETATNAVAPVRIMDPNSSNHKTINRPKVTFNSRISTRSAESTSGVIDEAADNNKCPKVCVCPLARLAYRRILFCNMY